MLRNPFRNLDHQKLKRSSEALKTKNDYFKIVNKRITIFAVIICLVFSIVVVRLAFLQIRGQEEYAMKLENYTIKKQQDQTPRGEIYDRSGKAVAKTVSALNITYFPPENITDREEWELAQKFAKQFNVNHDKFTLSDYQDAYFYLSEDGGASLLSADEQKQTTPDQEKLIRERLSEELITQSLSEEDLNAYAVYQAMNKAPASNTKVVMEDVDKEIVYYLEEHKDEYPGFDVDMGGWKREYPYENTFKDVLGRVSTNVQGVPAELKDYYEAKGYSMSDRVGLDGLEYQYEDLLSGTRKISEISYDENGIAVLTEENPGKKGYSLHLSIDIELQEKLDDLLEKVLRNADNDSRRNKFKKVFVVLMDPNTGEVYAMSGKQKLDDGTIINYSSGAYKETVIPGSIVKGATVYMGLTEGAITRDTIFYDSPIRFKGSEWKQSYNNYYNVNAVQALSKSSNVFMWYTVMKLAGVNYVQDGPLIINDFNGTIQLMRSYYSMFGLGVDTGLDVPSEETGLKGVSSDVGKFLDFAIGQYDTYTPMQMAQYASTLANGGKRIQPKLVNTATEVNSENIVFENKTTILSTLRGDLNNLDVVREGFHRCVLDGNCGDVKNLPYDVAAKTGTAENDATNTSNAALIGWVPYDNAKVSFACSAPESDTNNGQNLAGNICTTDIMPVVLQDFFEKYPNK